MIPAVRSELRKFFTTRLWWGMAIAVFAAAAAFAVLFGIIVEQGTSGGPGGGGVTGDDTQIANTVYTAGIGVSYLLLLTIGILTIGGEFRHKTITATFLATPNRLRAMSAKVVALVVIGVFYGVLSLAGSVAVGSIVLSVIDQPAFPSGEVARTLALSLLVLALWALMGLGLGILIPNQVAALFIGVAVAWIVEPLLGLLLTIWDFSRENIAPYLPTSATNAILNTASQNPDEIRLEWWGGALTLVIYAAVLASFGIWRLTRQDVA
ncbi:ABC transporter permease [Phycicoccus sp. CSK15P-2]|uniref:ABC transporter permease n=1 Tax=Phycicoccus sp. CSK15P-2 TaxID=2807627 RepID=UPI00195000BA|nr:ABC transporter permease [Phycicoccus sp. CSK15P-2]MBM6405261.1 ABC transporter permease [Phycicoccus sp. CSK15P-2]